MSNFKFSVVVLAASLSIGCTINGGDVVEEDRNKIVQCVDTRDGETFMFNSNTITNVRQGFGAPSSVDITTVDGKHMTITSDMEAWLKCKKTN